MNEKVWGGSSSLWGRCWYEKRKEVDWKSADFAITLCGSANETCVTMPWPETCKRIHWPIDDPETEQDYRNARDEIKERIIDFLETL